MSQQRKTYTHGFELEAICLADTRESGLLRLAPIVHADAAEDIDRRKKEYNFVGVFYHW